MEVKGLRLLSCHECINQDDKMDKGMTIHSEYLTLNFKGKALVQENSKRSLEFPMEDGYFSASN